MTIQENEVAEEEEDDNCAICFNKLNGHDTYTIPECKHKFHTNCIMTWFRMGHSKCPLCNDKGINQDITQSNLTFSLIHNNIDEYSWIYKRRVLQENYKKMRRLSKRETASKHLKKSVKKLENQEKKLKNLSIEQKNFLISKQENLTVKEIIKKNKQYRDKMWKTRRNISNLKSYIGLQFRNETIIIPTIQSV
jgi:hypothetical protein